MGCYCIFYVYIYLSVTLVNPNLRTEKSKKDLTKMLGQDLTILKDLETIQNAQK